MVRSAGDGGGPTNPLTRSGRLRELLQELNEAEFDQFIRYWQQRDEQFTESKDGFSAWKCSIILSAGLREASRRRPQSKSP